MSATIVRRALTTAATFLALPLVHNANFSGRKDTQCGIKLWIKRAQLIKRCDFEGPGMFAPVTVWDPSLRLDKMERMPQPESKRPKIARTDTTAPSISLKEMIHNTQLNAPATADMDINDGEEDAEAPLRRALSVA